jgi:hypothetical protein
LVSVSLDLPFKRPCTVRAFFPERSSLSHLFRDLHKI